MNLSDYPFHFEVYIHNKCFGLCLHYCLKFWSIWTLLSSPSSTETLCLYLSSIWPLLKNHNPPVHTGLFLPSLAQTFWSVPKQNFPSPSPSLPPSIFHKRTVTNLFECCLRRRRKDGWADRRGGGLVSGMVASSFTAYISHTFADCWWKGGGLAEVVYGALGEWGEGALYVKCMHVYRNVLVRETEREGERRGYSENWRSKFIIVMAFSGIHFPMVCWQPVVSAYQPPSSPTTPCDWQHWASA